MISKAIIARGGVQPCVGAPLGMPLKRNIMDIAPKLTNSLALVTF